MVVDDEPAVAGITRTTLVSQMDSVVADFNDPLEAIQNLEAEEYGVLVCDYQMPGMNGLELAEKAVTINPDIVVVLVSAFISKEILLNGLNNGTIWKCIEKPWTTDEIVEVVAEAIERYHDKTGGAPRQAAGTPSGDDGKVVIKKGALMMRPRAGSVLHKKRYIMKGIPVKPTPVKKRIVVNSKGASAVTSKPTDVGSFTSDRYINLRKITVGGSGELYRADDTLLGMPVAIKLLAAHIAKDAEAISALFAEARAAMQLSHKHIVRLHNIDEHNGFYYLVMEYIDGVTLYDYLQDAGPLPTETVIQILDILDDAISYAHRRGIYHRDITPANIMITNEGVLKIIDYGLACLAGRASESDFICGTPYYISPEELEQKPVDGRSDLFSIAIMTHQLLTGSLPMTADQEGVDMHDFVPTCMPSLPLDVQRVMHKGWARDPDQRYEDLHSFVEAMKKAMSG
jgi:CheY-like chemotaxis protein